MLSRPKGSPPTLRSGGRCRPAARALVLEAVEEERHRAVVGECPQLVAVEEVGSGEVTTAPELLDSRLDTRLTEIRAARSPVQGERACG